jgi:osmotically-inducible protein OsmY
MKRFLRSAALVVASLCVSGFAAAPAHHEKRSDAEIEAAIRAKLTKSKIGKDGFTVHVHNGVATWQGSTKVMQHKGSATRMAKTAGATQVVNNIKISDEARAAAAGNLTGQPKRAVVKEN